MISSFKGFLIEEEKTVYFTFGRMNPPTVGHEKLIAALAKNAGTNPYRVFVSQSQDAKKNPLAYKDKIKIIRKMFPKYARSIMMNTSVKTVFDACVSMYEEGYVKVVMVVGSDRKLEFETLLNKYNGQKGRHGLYNFNKIIVLSAGQRDPDAEGVEGMSASKMRDAASAADFTQFSQGIPRGVSNSDTKGIYNAVRKGMGLKESKDTTRHIQLESVSEVRESYINGTLFKEGDTVVIKESGELAKVKNLGSNYVIVEASGSIYRKWLDAIEKVEESLSESKIYDVAKFSMARQDEPQIGIDDMKGFKDFKEQNAEDPDIGDRKGSQPANYHKGLSKPTKLARDRQFKKQAKMADNNPAAYKSAPGDKTAKTKPSKYTKAFKDMYDEQSVKVVKNRISNEREAEKRSDEIDAKRQDRMLDRARLIQVKQINRRTK